MEKRAQALTWWRTQREQQQIELTKKHLPFANHRYLTGDQVEKIYDKETFLPMVDLSNYSLKQLL